ncbi:hypothetical protein GGF46_001455 [Coemansia sp. RSA 552]|nr:hypothetical protein GGF46_001455 [Coemansia sp. RSA 552]
MLYTQVRRKVLPSHYFYTNLASVLGRGKDDGRDAACVYGWWCRRCLMSRGMRIRMIRCTGWRLRRVTVMIGCAIRNGRRDLAMQWFQMYRKEKVPRLKAAASKLADARGL